MAHDDKSQDNMGILFCEKVVRECWANVEKHKSEISIILERGTIETDRDLSLLLAAGNAFMQRVILSEVDDKVFKLKEQGDVPCGRNYESCDHCELQDCDYFTK